ncbi:MAG: ABC transporter substrate-binding protein [Planctomycetes bacterium]|nr:ABC transporter substrate-binding protein [Planctomycetota bacterium]
MYRSALASHAVSLCLSIPGGLLLSGLVGCAREAPGAAGTAAAQEGYPRLIELPSGARMLVTSEPRRIVPANAGALDLLTELVGPDRLAALPRQALDYSVLAERGASERAAWDALPRFERYLAEPLLAGRADLVVSDPWGALETTQRLREVGVNVLELPDVSCMADVEANLRLLGRALDLEPRAETVIAAWRRRADALRARGAGRGQRALAYSYYGSQGACAGSGSTLAEVFALCGLANAAGHLHGHASMSFEDLLALDPDWIVVAHRGEGEGEGGTIALLRSEPVLAQLAAVRGQRIVELPQRLFASNSQQLLEAAELLSERLERARAARRE